MATMVRVEAAAAAMATEPGELPPSVEQEGCGWCRRGGAGGPGPGVWGQAPFAAMKSASIFSPAACPSSK